MQHPKLEGVPNLGYNRVSGLSSPEQGVQGQNQKLGVDRLKMEMLYTAEMGPLNSLDLSTLKLTSSPRIRMLNNMQNVVFLGPFSTTSKVIYHKIHLLVTIFPLHPHYIPIISPLYPIQSPCRSLKMMDLWPSAARFVLPPLGSRAGSVIVPPPQSPWQGPGTRGALVCVYQKHGSLNVPNSD